MPDPTSADHRHDEAAGLSKDAIDSVAARLSHAEDSRVAIPPLTTAHPDLTLADAYAIQRSWIGRKVEAGRRVIGHKIGLTSRAMQRMVDFNEPDYGTLLDDMLYEDGSELPAGRFITPMLECELAFVLKRNLAGPHCTLSQVLAATEYVVPAVEIVDLRILATDPETGRKRTILDNIADNAANAALVLGGRPVRPDAVDLRWVGAICRRNLVIEETGIAAAVLNHPARGVQWLANKLAAHEEELKAGEIVLGGSFTRVVDARAGDIFSVDFGALGDLTCAFA